MRGGIVSIAMETVSFELFAAIEIVAVGLPEVNGDGLCTHLDTLRQS